jgi:hypothetical protein
LPSRVGLGRPGDLAVAADGEAPGGDGTFLVDRFIYQGLPHAQRRRAALRSDRDEPITAQNEIGSLGK